MITINIHPSNLFFVVQRQVGQANLINIPNFKMKSQRLNYDVLI